MGTPATTTFTWLDYDEEETRKARELYAALDTESVDALGLGSIRDGFANLLFPGTSTIQTRARYFVLVPYAAQAVARRAPRDARQFDRWFRDAELATMQSLKAVRTNGTGVIGAVAGPRTKRLPSEVYWNGMARWGLVRAGAEASGELRSLAAYRAWVLASPRRLMDAPDEGTTVVPFFDELPAPPTDFPGEKLSILPRKAEATYLLDRMKRLTVTINPVNGEKAGTLLGAMAADRRAGSAASIFAIDPSGLEPFTARLLRQAQGFARVMQGARLLYNRLLFVEFAAAGLGESPGSIDALTELEDAWVATVTAERDLLQEWRSGLDDLLTTQRLAGVRVSPSSQRFVREWAQVAVESPRAALDSQVCRSAVKDREAAIKRRRGTARLSERAALERWRGALFGRGYMDFRFGIARGHIDDCRRARG